MDHDHSSPENENQRHRSKVNVVTRSVWTRSSIEDSFSS